jgi:hypothetical protein
LQFILLNSNHTTLLAKGTAATQNTTFIDSSTNNHTITANGDVYQGTFSPYRSGGYSLYLDGVDDNVTVPYNSTAFNMGTTTNFTMEAWINIPSYGKNILVVYPGAATGNWIWLVDGSGYLSLYVYPSISYWTPTGATVPLNEWVHVALTRSGSTWQMYVNGVSAGTLNESQSFWATSNTLYIGSRPTSGYANGYIGGIRIIKGTAIYSGNFMPPEDVFDVVAGTSLLVCNNKNRLYDESTYSHTVTPNNGASIVPFSRFDYERYDASTNGGSVYLAGTGVDYLSIPASLQFLPGENTDFTFEVWVYLTATPGAQGAQIVGTGEYGTNSDWSIGINSSRIPSFYINLPFTVASDTAMNLNEWNHIAVSRSGTETNNLKLFLNGILVGQASTNVSLDRTGNNLTIGADANGDESIFTGYTSDIRLVNGTALYTTDFTPPTAPLEAITNTSLLLNFTNAGVQDYSQVSNLKLLGNATGSNTQTKNASYSMYFDGTGDYATIPLTTELQFGTGDFTVELWAYLDSTKTTQQCLFNNYSTWAAGALGLFANHASGTANKYQISYNGSGFPNLNSSSDVIRDAWHHLAVVRSNGTITLYLNGVSEGSFSGTAALNGVGGWFIGDAGDNISTYTVKGYIEDLRVTKGLARYTANFTPPTLELLG